MCQGEASGAVGCGEGKPEAVVFALSEAAPVSLDVLLGFMVITPYVGPEEDFDDNLRDAYFDCRPSANFDD